MKDTFTLLIQDIVYNEEFDSIRPDIYHLFTLSKRTNPNDIHGVYGIITRLFELLEPMSGKDNVYDVMVYLDKLLSENNDEELKELFLIFNNILMSENKKQATFTSQFRNDLYNSIREDGIETTMEEVDHAINWLISDLLKDGYILEEITLSGSMGASIDANVIVKDKYDTTYYGTVIFLVYESGSVIPGYDINTFLSETEKKRL